jgi:hypothetical protein
MVSILSSYIFHYLLYLFVFLTFLPVFILNTSCAFQRGAQRGDRNNCNSGCGTGQNCFSNNDDPDNQCTPNAGGIFCDDLVGDFEMLFECIFNAGLEAAALDPDVASGREELPAFTSGRVSITDSRQHSDLKARSP